VKSVDGVKTPKITKDEMERARIAALGAVIGGRVSSGDILERTVLFAASGRNPASVADYVAAIKSVTLEDIDRLRGKCNFVNGTIVIMGDSSCAASTLIDLGLRGNSLIVR
jgi:predicted Zn-dependent peptidase